ncbi:cytochrome P450 CYP4/CYP19/CYP26 subfamily protein [Xylaria telfairii]|nr:cytochrome P450 CYP4/CYP19/CYP26 subfamily protein [Xylaria telfairii]
MDFLFAAPLVACLLFFSYGLFARRRLWHIPGPRLACITDLQRVLWVRTKKAHLIHQEVHNKYGELVRTGPNNVMFSNPEAISTVYTTRTGFPKSQFYTTLQPYTPKGGSLPAVFNTPDENIHRQLKTPIANLFASNNILNYEPGVDETLSIMKEKLDSQYVDHSQVFQLSSWIQYFAFDVMGTLAFSKRYGFLDTGKDAGGILANIKQFMRTAAPWTQVPWFDAILRKNRIGDWFQRHLFSAPSMGVLGIVAKIINEKKIALASSKRGVEQTGEGPESQSEKKTGKDFLTRYLQLYEANPGTVFPWAPTAWTFSNVIAGSDSVGSLMCTTMFNLLIYPHTLRKLQDELDAANVSRPFPKYSEIRHLPYLNSCVQEGVRMHPPFCLPFERVVPKGGITILGQFLPEGTVVGGNPYVVNRHKGTFGEDAEFWRPERWLENGEEHRKKLEASILTFGSGRRVCLGKHLGILEITKLISFLVTNYDINIVDPERFEVENSWFFFQQGLYAQIKKRSATV